MEKCLRVVGTDKLAEKKVDLVELLGVEAEMVEDGDKFEQLGES